MNLILSLIKSRILGSLIVFSYVWGIALGNFAHNLVHHYDDHHVHSIPCLIIGLNEAPSDATQNFSQSPNISLKSCDFKIALQNVNRTSIGGSAPTLINIVSSFVVQDFLEIDLVYIKKVLVSSTSSRGPPSFV